MEKWLEDRGWMIEDRQAYRNPFDLRSAILDLRSATLDLRSAILDLRSATLDPLSSIRYPRSFFAVVGRILYRWEPCLAIHQREPFHAATFPFLPPRPHALPAAADPAPASLCIPVPRSFPGSG